MKKLAAIAWHAALVLASIVLTLTVADIALRFTDLRGQIIGFGISGHYAHDDSGMVDLAPNYATSTFYFADGKMPVWTNNIGCFDEHIEPGTAPYALLLGDSFVWGYAPFETKWGTLLEKQLQMRVAKCGVAGFGTKQELEKGRRVIEYLGSPSLIVVGYFMNDLADDAWIASGSDFNPRCPSGFASDFRCFLYHHSVLANMLRNELARSEFGFLQSIGNLLFALPKIGPLGEESQRETHNANLSGFAELAKEHGAQVLFVLIPAKQLSENPEATLDPVTEETRAYLEAKGIPFLNLLPHFHAAYATDSTPLYWPRDAHLNVAGNALVASLVAEYIDAQGLAK